MRVAALVFRDDRRHDGVAAGKGDADPQDALLIFSQVGKFVLHCPVFFLEVCGVLPKDLSGIGELQGNMADEELAVQLLFQIGDVGAQGLLGDVESIGGFCEAALLGGHEKVVHGKKVHIKPPEYKKESLTESSKSPASIAKSNKQWVGTCLYQEECKLLLINCGAVIGL